MSKMGSENYKIVRIKLSKCYTRKLPIRDSTKIFMD